jgi:hypothetical protein
MEVLGEKPVPEPLWPPQISHREAQDLIFASTVTESTCVMAWLPTVCCYMVRQ